MPALLLFEALLQRLHQFIPAAQGLDLRLFGVRQIPFSHFLEPVGRQLARKQREQVFGALEMRRESPVEPVVVALVLDQTSARQIVKALGARLAQTPLERLEQRQKFRDGHRHAGEAQQKKEPNEHSGG